MRKNEFSFSRIFNSFKKPKYDRNSFSQTFSKRKVFDKDVEEASFYEINKDVKEDEVSQEEIDRILDKISQNGYQGLTDREKKVLFQASKKK